MKNRSIPALAAALLISAAVPGSAAALDPNTHTVTVKGIDGKVIATYNIEHGKPVDLSGIDTAAMTYHPDVYTEIGFSQWAPYPGKITADTTINALYKKMTISCSGEPAKKEYYSLASPISISGVSVTISEETQLPKEKSDGTYSIELKKDVHNITDKCTTSPATVSEAFADGKTKVSVSVYPIIEKKAIFSYDITFVRDFGDANHDGSCDAADGSAILKYYTDLSTGSAKVPDAELNLCDIDRNGSVDAADASKVLQFYTILSTGDPNKTWDDFLS